MAVEEVLNLSAGEIGKEIGKDVISNLPPEAAAGLSSLLKIIEAAGVILIIYLIILVIRAVFSIKTNLRIKKISNNVEQINSKLDSLVRNKAPKPSKK